MVVWAASTITFFIPRISDVNPIRERFAELARLGGFAPGDLEKIVEERNDRFNFYKKKLEGQPVRFLDIPDNVQSSLHLAVIRLQNKSKHQHREIFEGMRAAGIGVQLHYSPVHLQPYYRERGFAEGDYPESEKYGKDAMSIPLFPGLSESDQEYVVDILTKLLK